MTAYIDYTRLLIEVSLADSVSTSTTRDGAMSTEAAVITGVSSPSPSPPA